MDTSTNAPANAVRAVGENEKATTTHKNDEIPFSTTYQYDPSLADGQTKVITVGKNGSDSYDLYEITNTVTNKVVYSKKLHENKTEPVNEVIGVGANVTKKTTRIIKVTDPAGEVNTTVQAVNLNRTPTVDSKTGKVTYSNWSTDTWQEFDTPTIKGYTPTKSNVPEVQVDGDTQDQTINITYNANKQTGYITYVDQEGNTIHQQTITVTPEVPAGWKIVSEEVPLHITVTGDGITSRIITIAHSTVTVQPTDPKIPADTLPDNPGKKYPSGVAKDDLNHTATRTVTITDLSDKKPPSKNKPPIFHGQLR